MTTTVNLTDRELADLQQLTGETDPTAALQAAMAEYLKYARRQRLKEKSGRVKMQENWQDLEQAEMDHSDACSRSSAD